MCTTALTRIEPIDDVMDCLVAANGAVNPTGSYLAKVKNQWVAAPTSSGAQTKPPCTRISWFKKHGLDLKAMYPAQPGKTPRQDEWPWDAFVKYAELAQKGGMTFGLGMGGNDNTDAIDTHGALFRAFGATLIDSEGAIQPFCGKTRISPGPARCLSTVICTCMMVEGR